MKIPDTAGSLAATGGIFTGDMPPTRNSIYVQIDIQAPLERVWQCTQTPELHQQWDLRFTEIRYLPRHDPDLAQRFLYATRIGLGLNIRGEGETVGTHDAPSGQRTSALKFWSEDPKSLIRTGSGYWKYIPRGDDTQAVRFLTGYDYEVRFGLLGRVFDRLIFRPLMGWATAWSFDRLRLWIEKGISPGAAMRQSLVVATARLALAMVWFYQGAFPKLIFRHSDELAVLRAAGFSNAVAKAVRGGAGVAEIALGVIFVIAWRARWPLWVTLIFMPVAIAAVAVETPGYLVAAFNPIALNISMFALALIAMLGMEDLPSARCCVRRPPLEGT